MSVNVLLVDDSAVIRGLMSKALANNSNISVVGTASDGILAISMATKLQPDVIVLDIEMPRMDGLTALPELLRASPNSRVIMASTLTARNASISLQALSLGASDYIAKPSANSGQDAEVFYRELVAKILALGSRRDSKTPARTPVPTFVSAAKAPAKPYPVLAAGMPLNPAGISALAIASSTGGPQALTSLFSQFKGQLKNVPIFITQHMPPTFTTILAEQLTKIGERPCQEAKNSEIVMPGYAYIAPGDYHLVVTKNADGQAVVHVNQDPPENYCRPAADPMFRSLSLVYGSRLSAAVLTGMGQDGMEGAKEIVRKGGSVIAQSEASCVVYGMPKAIVENDLCKAVLPLNEMGAFLIRQIDGTTK